MLLKEGASVSSRDLRGNTALHLAVNNSTSSNIIDNIFTAGPQSRANDIGLFPIHVAVQVKVQKVPTTQEYGGFFGFILI